MQIDRRSQISQSRLPLAILSLLGDGRQGDKSRDFSTIDSEFLLQVRLPNTHC